MAQCVRAYERAGRGALRLDISKSPVPDLPWYSVSTCAPGAGRPVEAIDIQTSADMVNGLTGSNLWSDGSPQFPARGRTPLGALFGDGRLAAPDVSSTASPGNPLFPDIVLAYDLWHYWLAPLGTDIASVWKLNEGERVGLPSGADRHGFFYAPARTWPRSR